MKSFLLLSLLATLIVITGCACDDSPRTHTTTTTEETVIQPGK